MTYTFVQVNMISVGPPKSLAYGLSVLELRHYIYAGIRKNWLTTNDLISQRIAWIKYKDFLYFCLCKHDLLFESQKYIFSK